MSSLKNFELGKNKIPFIVNNTRYLMIFRHIQRENLVKEISTCYLSQKYDATETTLPMPESLSGTTSTDPAHR